MQYSQQQLKLLVIWIPLVFSFVYAALCALFTLFHSSALTPSLQDKLVTDTLQTFFLSLLILLPNILLSLIMYIYSNTQQFIGNRLLIPCITAIIGGIVPVIYMYQFFYRGQAQADLQVPFLSYGFPFVYFFGMMIGWVIGIFIVPSLPKNT